jgi:hypothetical protein
MLRAKFYVVLLLALLADGLLVTMQSDDRVLIGWNLCQSISSKGQFSVTQDHTPAKARLSTTCFGSEEMAQPDQSQRRVEVESNDCNLFVHSAVRDPSVRER